VIVLIEGQPIVEYHSEQSINGLTPKLEPHYTPNVKIKVYVSDILTISNYTEEKEYRIKDKYRNEIVADKLPYLGEGAKIGSVEIYIYKSYKDASIARSKITDTY